MPQRMHVDEVEISERLVRSMVDDQFPHFRAETLSIVEPWGTDNAIWRLGRDHVVRLPRMERSVGQIAFEAAWMPRLAPHLTVEIPEPVVVGSPADGYPFEWAVHRWVAGEGAGPSTIGDPIQFALDVAQVVAEVQCIDPVGAPAAKNRARPLHDYDVSTRKYIESARHLIDVAAAVAVWEEALDATPHQGPPRWVHGDLEGNCLVSGGRLSGLVDWGSACAGDPAVDVQVVWSPLFTEESRGAFLDALEVDEATIARSRGAAINQACGALPYYLDTYPLIVERSWHKLDVLGVGRLDADR